MIRQPLAGFFEWRGLAKRIVNMACFYGGWLICMHEATGPTPYFGSLVVAALLVYHMIFTHAFWVDAILIASLAILGTIIDSAYIWTGLIDYQGGYSCCPSIAPLWITSLWALYASSVNHSLEWLKLHLYLIAAPLGAAGAISSYLVGVELGAITIHHSPVVTFAIIGLVWSVIVPASLIFADRLRISTAS